MTQECNSCGDFGAETCFDCDIRWCDECWNTDVHREVCKVTDDWLSRFVAAEDLEPRHIFSYLGSFKEYRVVDKPTPDPSYPGRVLVTVQHFRGPMKIRLQAREQCTVRGPKAS